MIKKFLRQYFSKEIRQAAAALAAETENNFLVGARGMNGDFRELYEYDRQQILEECLDAWRNNPLARRIVGLTTQYTVGGGISISSDHPGTDDFIKAFWDHPLNQLDARVYEWSDELTRAGELFIALSTDESGMSYARCVPACNIAEIITVENDLAQEEAYQEVSENGEGRTWQAPKADEPVCMLHYAVNRPAGTKHGESDLAPLLRWLKRYAGWLEDRARLNRWRSTFVYVVSNNFVSETERAARQAALTAVPPTPGSILVKDNTETWEIISPNLEAGDAGEDGLALKKMIAAGAGVPLHFLAEPESSTRTTAESAGGPTYRHFEQRQKYFMWLLRDLLGEVVRRRSMIDARVNRDAVISVIGADLSARDNASQAIAASTITNAAKELRDRGLIDDNELARLVYKFAGEVVDIERLLQDGAAAGKVKNLNPAAEKRPSSAPVERTPGAKVAPDGETKGIAAI